MSILIHLLLVLDIIVSLLLILLVLMQRPKNEGLGAAFGGGMTENLFGAQTTNVLSTITRWLGGIFFALSLLLSFLYSRQAAGVSSIEKRLGGLPAVKTPATQPATAPLTPLESEPSGTAPAPNTVPGTTPEPALNPPAPGRPPVTPGNESSPATPAANTPANLPPRSEQTAPALGTESAPSTPGTSSPAARKKAKATPKP